MENNEIILRVGAEGGSLTLYGVRTKQGWLFSREVIDQTPLPLNVPGIKHRTKVVSSW